MKIRHSSQDCPVCFPPRRRDYWFSMGIAITGIAIGATLIVLKLLGVIQ